MRRIRSIAVLAAAVLARSLFTWADQRIESQTLSPRLWLVDWNFGGEDLRQAPFVMLNWNVQFTKWHFQILAGYGTGWESKYVSDEKIANAVSPPNECLPRFRRRDTLEVESRIDLQWHLARKFSLEGMNRALNLPWAPGIIYAGAAYHYVEFDFEAPLGRAEYYYHGPEMLLGLSQPFFIDGLSLRASATWMPHAWFTGEAPDVIGTASETSDGFLYDVGVAYSTVVGMPLHLAAGYRAQALYANGIIAEDTFKGLYLEIGIRL